MQDQIELIVEPKRRGSGFSFAVAVSFVLHSLLLVLFLRSYRPVAELPQATPITRYVQLIKQNPQQFVEAPGPAVDRAPLNAPFSDANRRASIPAPTGQEPTLRPGDGAGLFTPPAGSSAPPETVAQQRPENRNNASPREPQQAAGGELQSPSRIPPLHTQASAMGSSINWRSAIQDAAKIASLGGAQGLDLGAAGSGGEQGFAEAGPLSFETQWYDWGPYAQSMVSKIRVNWYSVMPSIIRTGMKGVVTIRFTIERDGRISEVIMLSSSTVPPYDFAARKAIELSSPLNPLPADFPNPRERVTAMFYYNSSVR